MLAQTRSSACLCWAEHELPAAQVNYGETIKLVGSAPELGGWDIGAAPELAWSDGDVWTTTLELPPGDVHFKVATAAFKFVLWASIQ